MRAGGRQSRQGSQARRSNGRGSSAVSLLKQDHRAVATLLRRFEQASGGERVQIAQRICQELTIHARIEEELLYPAARRALKEDDRELVAEAAVEHASLKNLVGQIESSRSTDELYEAKVKVLGEYVKHHVREEENELFPRLQRTEIDLEALGEQLAARKAELSASMGMRGEEMEESEEADLASNLSPSLTAGHRGARPMLGR